MTAVAAAVSSWPPTATTTTPPSRPSGSLKGREVKELKFLGGMEFWEKISRIATGALLFAQVHAGKIGGWCATATDNLNGFIGVSGALGMFGRVNVFVNGSITEKYREGRIGVAKVASSVCIAAGKVFEFTKWLGSIGVIALGKTAASCARIPLFGAVTSVALGKVKDGLMFLGAVFSIAEAGVKLAKPGDKDWFRLCLSIANDIGKMTLITVSFFFSSMIFSYGFAAAAITTSFLSVVKIIRDDVTKK